MKIFIDTSAWIALEVQNDIYHPQAGQYEKEIKKRRALLFTNDYVLAETYTRLIYDFHFKAAKQFKTKIELGLEKTLTLLEIDLPVRERAWEEFEKYSDHKLSFTDGTIIANFKDYNLDEIFTFDKHFRECNLPTNSF